MIKNDSIEILAPGGSFVSLKSAIDSGADAVYFGGSRFGARANAVNLSKEDISEAVRYAHLRGVKLYVTVNTLVTDDELEECFDFLKFCYEEGVDGVIVQDFGIVNMIKQYFPLFRLHASTQMTVHNLDGVLQAQEMGFDRVVLSRELSMNEIKYIAENSDAELEVFVHGALCMSYSGQCLFSSFLGGRSGNRGNCAQPCRMPYTLLDSDGNKVSENNKYLLSLKDLCLIERIGELRRIGVSSLKIEGRMKSEAYVSAVCGIYNKYRDGGRVEEADLTLLENIFSRGGFTDGYINSEYGRKMLSYDKNHDNIFDSATDDVIEKAKSFAGIERTIAVDGCFSMKEGEYPAFSVEYNGMTFSAQGENPVEKAQNTPMSEERVVAQLSKLGGTVFEYSSLKCDVGEGLFITVKEINNIRRRVFEQLEDYILGDGRRCEFKFTGIVKSKKTKALKPVLTASVCNLTQAQAAYDIGFEKIYIPYHVYMSDKEFFDSEKDIFVLKLPPVLHNDKNFEFGKIALDEVCVTNIYGLKTFAGKKSIHTDYRMNTFNSLSVKELAKYGVKSYALSPELTINQAQQVSGIIPAEIVVYGRISLMTVRNCVVRSAKKGCGCNRDEVFYLKDRKNISFPVLTDKDTCTNIIYNSAPVVMSDRMRELVPIGASMHRFDFTVESPQEMADIVALYEKNKKYNGFFTRGHWYNGVL